MRRPRLVVSSESGDAHYHCISRVAGALMLLGHSELCVLQAQMKLVAEYCGLDIITYALMTNHYHILLRVPKRRVVSDAELLARYRKMYPSLKAQQARALALVEADMKVGGELSKAWRERQLRQMFDVSRFNKLLKMRFSIWYNRTHQRIGTFWSERFKSVLVESGLALQTIAAYIDLNCVRAGLVRDPKQYKFSGYAQAVAGDTEAQWGFFFLYNREWPEIEERYRCLLAGLIYKDGSASRGGSAVSGDADAQTSDGVFSTRLRCLVDSVVIGSADFVKAIADCLPEKGRRDAKLVTELAGAFVVHTLSRLRAVTSLG